MLVLVVGEFIKIIVHFPQRIKEQMDLQLCEERRQMGDVES